MVVKGWESKKLDCPVVIDNDILPNVYLSSIC